MSKKYSSIEVEVERVKEAEADLCRLANLKDEEIDLISRRDAVDFAIRSVRDEIEQIEKRLKNSKSA